MRWTDSPDRLTGWLVGLSEIGERVKGKGKGKGEGEGADGHVTENRRVTGSQVRRGEARERGLGAVNCTHVIVMWLIHTVTLSMSIKV